MVAEPEWFGGCGSHPHSTHLLTEEILVFTTEHRPAVLPTTADPEGARRPKVRMPSRDEHGDLQRLHLCLLL